MPDVKKPADRKPKAGAAKTVTVSGVKVTVSADALDDFELLDDLASLQDGNGSRLPAILRRLVGDEYKRVLDDLRAENGRVTVVRASEFITELFKEIAPNS